MYSEKRPTQKRSQRERGQALVEFALVVPIFLILVFGIVDFGMGLRAWIAITNSAREGARYGAVGESCDSIKVKAANTSPDLITTADVSVTGGADCGGLSGDQVTVTVTYDYQYITPLGNFVEGLAGGPLHMSATAKMRLE